MCRVGYFSCEWQVVQANISKFAEKRMRQMPRNRVNQIQERTPQSLFGQMLLAEISFVKSSIAMDINFGADAVLRARQIPLMGTTCIQISPRL